MTEYEIEPVAGLPGHLPPGERILWQGSPDWRVLARTALHTRLVAGYFVALTIVALVGGSTTGVVLTAALGVIGVALLHLLAWGSARTTIYTLTNRRIVLRIGIAVPKCINLPLGQVASLDLAERADRSGDVALTLLGAPKLGYLTLWPHARAWRVGRPQPQLRAIPEAATFAALAARACQAANPEGSITPVETLARPVSAPALAAHAA